MSMNETLSNTTCIIPSFLSQEEFWALQNGTELNSTLNDTGELVFKTWYPSGYSPIHIILASVVVTVLMIMVVVGNMLVIIAIVTEKALKNIQNWFIASLAVSDFFLGLVIMPFSLANELMGYWIFGFWWCEIHSAMDVLLCTASIMNLCLISLDRYWSITQMQRSRSSQIKFEFVQSYEVFLKTVLSYQQRQADCFTYSIVETVCLTHSDIDHGSLKLSFPSGLKPQVGLMPRILLQLRLRPYVSDVETHWLEV
ncbi:unnamed protein product [Leptidea sinapis]|uniref:G-protein coupled receptors family 1 profile domain-containing protein n=1 Tax=Leptidea sinapis TaxID=189913 RepID=A0A5E4QC20_9NEOP|nr:unnamed protein product [Leptidea sinapis]